MRVITGPNNGLVKSVMITAIKCVEQRNKPKRYYFYTELQKKCTFFKIYSSYLCMLYFEQFTFVVINHPFALLSILMHLTIIPCSANCVLCIDHTRETFQITRRRVQLKDLLELLITRLYTDIRDIIGGRLSQLDQDQYLYIFCWFRHKMHLAQNN